MYIKEVAVMEVASTVFRKNLSNYLKLVNEEDIYITKKNKVVAVLSSPEKAKLDSLKQLKGILKGNNTTLEEAREKRISEI